jgi:N-acyl-D-amino-acid deacylase
MNRRKLIAVVLVLIISQTVLSQQADILIKNGRIIDGTGNSWYNADIAIANGKIIYLGNSKNILAEKTIDARGLIVTPGFIDVHTHIEGGELTSPTANNFILDGVTTVVTGNCGSSTNDVQKYFHFLDSLKLSINVATLIGHNDVRKSVMGTANRPPTQNELLQMEALVAKAMKEGAVGLSTGLIYIPGTYSQTPEIVSLAKIASQFNGIYATHMRDEADSVVQAINEAITIGMQANIPVEISHFKVGGQQNWGRSKQTLQLVKDARNKGVEVTIDQYPYTASSTSLSTMIPDELLADGTDSIKARLQRPDVRNYTIDYMLRKLKNRKLKHFSYAVVASHRDDSTYNGKSIEEINLIKGKKHKAKYEAETVIELMINGGAGMVFHGMSEDDVKNIMQYPYNMFASDAGIRQYKQGVPHPRGYGTNARVLGKYVRDEKIISLEEAIRRMTSLPAQKFQLKNRGLLKEGMAADVVIIDEKEVQDMASFEDPHQYSKGFKYVIVNGKMVAENGIHMGVRSGLVLTGPGMNKSL